MTQGVFMHFRVIRRSLIFAPDQSGECHASTLVRLRDGRYLAAWFAGTKEGAADVAIYGAIRELDGRWCAPRQWARVDNLPHWNPVLFAPDDETIWLFFKVGERCDCWRTWVTRSHDCGRTWTTPALLVADDIGGRGPVKNKPIILSDGAWLAPNSLEDGDQWRVLTDRSSDSGRTWHASPEVAMDRARITGKGAIQPTLWESSPGHVHMLTRSASGFICRSDSSDSGRTWRELTPTALPNNNSGIDLAMAPDGTLLLALNPVAENWGARTPLTLAHSRDNGDTWQTCYTLETTPGRYSYPAVIATLAGFAGTYTWRRQSIAFWEGRIVG